MGWHLLLLAPACWPAAGDKENEMCKCVLSVREAVRVNSCLVMVFAANNNLDQCFLVMQLVLGLSPTAAVKHTSLSKCNCPSVNS